VYWCQLGYELTIIVYESGSSFVENLAIWMAWGRSEGGG
jgi:hypothetical protein